MSLLSPAELVIPNDYETEDCFLCDDKKEEYNFRYVPANRFKYIIKDVRRQRCREEEENVWASFVKQQELKGLVCNKNSIQSSAQGIKELLDKSMKEADEELKKLETEVLPNMIKKDCDTIENIGKRRLKVNNIRGSFSKEGPIMKDNRIGSTNLLLTIPEEGNNSAHMKKQEPEDFRSYIRKSRSSHAITRKKNLSKQMFHVTNDIEYSSSPETSTHRDIAIADGIIYIRPDPFIMYKILTMQSKVCELLDEISFRLGNIPVPDGIKDLQRRQQCVAEFIVRFSRNYLYDLNRYVKDIQRHMCIISPRARIKPNHRSLGLHMHAIEHKLLAAHQLLLHALIAYCKHIPSSILDGHPGKFREILQVVIDLKTMCDRLHLNTNYLDSGDIDILSLGKNIESKCNSILSKLKAYLDNDSPLDNNRTSSVTSFTSHSVNNKKRINRKQLTNRLSMYSINTKVPKNNPKQRINYRHKKDTRCNIADTKRVLNESVSADDLHPSPATLTLHEDVNQIDVKKQQSYTKEEDIKTMMNMLPIDSDNSSREFELLTQIETERHNNAALMSRRLKTKIFSNQQDVEKSETIEKIVKSTSTNNNNNELIKRTVITEEHLSNLVPVVANLMSFISDKRYQSPKNMDTKINTNANCDMCELFANDSYKCEHLRTNNISNETCKNKENMQLICMSSIDDSSKTSYYCDVSCQANCENLTELSDFEAKAKEGKQMMNSQNKIELIVSEEIETNLLRYRRDYQRLTESIPMYSSNTNNKPWDIVAWISDKLVDELIMEIATELQIDDVIQKLFELEFQEF